MLGYLFLFNIEYTKSIMMNKTEMEGNLQNGNFTLSYSANSRYNGTSETFDDLLLRGLSGDIKPGEWYIVYAAVIRILEELVSYFGVLGNILCLYILSRPTLRHTATSVFLRYLAVGDLLRLITFMVWNDRFINLYFRITDIDVFCKLHKFSLFFFGRMSSCSLIPISLERFTAVYFPFKVKVIFSKKAAFIIVGGITVFLALLNSYAFFAYGVIQIKSGKFCDISNEAFLVFRDRFHTMIEFCFYFLFPFLVLVTCNIAIILKISKQKMMRSKVSSTANKKVSSLTIMLLHVSLAFIVLVSPLVFFFILVKPFDPNGLPIAFRMGGLYSLSLLSTFNHCINVILYTIAMPKFKHEVIELLPCKRRAKVTPANSSGSDQSSKEQTTKTDS